MTKQEFKKTCKIRGLASVKICEEYIKKYKKSEYTDKDLQNIYSIDYNQLYSCRPHNYNQKDRSFYYMDTDNYALTKDDKF